MKIHDITRELFSTPVFPGDPEPKYTFVNSMKYGDEYNLSNISLCPHNSTHMDAPYHFLNNGKTIENVELSKCIGKCVVMEVDENIGREEIKQLADSGVSRILFKGKKSLTKEAAKQLVNQGIVLVGVECQVIAIKGEETAVHRVLLKDEVVILENLDLSMVDEGEYELVALPLKMKEIEASPIRAILIER
ncbi:MAG: cyclase family protein [Suipraeoptans sp.]